MRFLLAAFGDPGHAFPMIALGKQLHTAGHTVTLETWSKWQEYVESEGLEFQPALEISPLDGDTVKPYQAVVKAAEHTRPTVKNFKPDVVVHDILTLAPALAAELEGVPTATLIPHLYPALEQGMPPFSSGARAPITAVGRRLWQSVQSITDRGLKQGRAELNGTRRRLNLAPLKHFHGGLSQSLVMVATLPELEYPRKWPEHVHVTGPLIWEPPTDTVEVPKGDGPLVLIAPSTSQDPDGKLLQSATKGLAKLPVRVLVTLNGHPPPSNFKPASNTTVVDWLSYTQIMPECELVICHAGHGTLVRALTAGCSVIACPVAGDMNENAARLDWAGLGLRIPNKLLTPRSVEAATRTVLSDDSYKNRILVLNKEQTSQQLPSVEQLLTRTR